MNCTVEEGAYSAPMPWIGLYITAASIACFIAMLVDLILGFRHRKFWFPCKLFSLNATSLTLLAIATKIPVDLSTPMLGAQEQFIKLTGTTLVYTSMVNFMSSLGAIEDSQVILNVVPLAILVITVIVNICIQMGTGIVHDFMPEHIITLAFIFIELLITCSSALAVSSMKRLLKKQYKLKHEQMPLEYESQQPREWPDYDSVRSMLETLKRHAKKYWLVALTCDPQYVLSRSCPSRVSDICCFLEACVWIEALVRMLKRESVHVCKNSSDYKWSITCIWVSQVLAVAVGLFSANYRTWYQVDVEDPRSSTVEYRDARSSGDPGSSTVDDSDARSSGDPGGFKECDEITCIMGTNVERFWIQTLEEWKDGALPFDIGSRQRRRLLYRSKNLILEVIKLIQIEVVGLCKAATGKASRRPRPSRVPRRGEIKSMIMDAVRGLMSMMKLKMIARLLFLSSAVRVI